MGVTQPNILLESGTNEVEILELFIDEEGYRGFYGVNVAKILEIIPLPPKIMSPPHLKESFVTGMFNHRGKIIALIDLAAWLKRSRSEKVAPKVLVTEFNNLVTAFLVSGVNRIYRVQWGDIRPLEGYMDGMSDRITSVIELEKRIVFLLDLEKAIADLNPDLAIAAPSQIPPGMGVDAGYKPIKVLHADDSLVVRNAVKRLLEEKGLFSVESVVNGDEAWAHISASAVKSRSAGTPLGDLIEIVLTDIEMPGMDGYHLCKRIKDDGGLKSLPVVLFSSLINDKLLHKGEAVGADGQFAKPDLQLMNLMKELVDKRRELPEDNASR
jgi:two-component system, chemotaxis family, chemotaxis protein CheV